MLIREVVLAIAGFSFGLVTAGGVFTVLVTVGLIPRFAGRTRTAEKVFLYEEMIIAGTVTGIFFSIFDIAFKIGQKIQFIGLTGRYMGLIFFVIYGIFSGAFEGALAMAIAEMLDAMPIFYRRLGLGRCKKISSYLKPILFCIAIGKTIGAIIYFWYEP